MKKSGLGPSPFGLGLRLDPPLVADLASKSLLRTPLQGFNAMKSNSPSTLNIPKISPVLIDLKGKNYFSQDRFINLRPTFENYSLTQNFNIWIRMCVNDLRQGCQIFLGTWYQIRKICTKWTQNVPIGHKNGHNISQMTINIQNGHEIFQMAMKYISIFQSKAPKIYTNWDFWFEKKPSGNPDLRSRFRLQVLSTAPHSWPRYTWIVVKQFEWKNVRFLLTIFFPGSYITKILRSKNKANVANVLGC
jgi:hypothetical protein